MKIPNQNLELIQLVRDFKNEGKVAKISPKSFLQ